jgi:probable DNA metabolism protein
MQVFVYDGSYEGLLTAIFNVYECKIETVTLVPAHQPMPSLFSDSHIVQTDKDKSDRVWKGLDQHISKAAVDDLYVAFLAGTKGIEDTILQYIQYVFSNKNSVERDYSHPAVLTIIQTVKKVRREKHRMEAFVRFQLTKDQLYYAVVQPDFNVLPLISDHFEKRYADQRWMIYDTLRKYGIYYDLQTVQEVSIDFKTDLQEGERITTLYDEKEELYQHLWKTYFDSVNIAARKNMTLHIRHMPRRYWKYLPEKKPIT